jgi:uncharacterized protein (DUF1015 family)
MNIKEFKPYLFSCDIKEVVSPPFDTITPEQEKKLRSARCNITALSMPETMNNRISPKKILDKWLKDGFIYEYDKDIIIILKQVFYINKEAVSRYGIISLLELNGTISAHENTFDKQVLERQQIMEELQAEPEPIFIVIPDNSFDKLIKRYAADLEEKFKFEEPSGVENYVYFLDDTHRITKVKESLENIQGIVADGHHRTQAIRNLEAETGDSFWNYALAYTTSIYGNGLMIGGVDRLVYRLNFEENLNKIKNLFDVYTEKTMEDDNTIRVYSRGLFYRLIPKEYVINETFGSAKPLSTEIINSILFQNVFGLTRDEMEKKVGYIYNTTEAINAVDRHECEFAVLIPSWQKDDFLNLTLNNRIFPQKSTYFYPKIPSGIAIYQRPS